MRCEICGRNSCAIWMHSIEEQDKLTERNSMSDDVDTLRKELQDLREEMSELKAQLDKYNEGDGL